MASKMASKSPGGPRWLPTRPERVQDAFKFVQEASKTAKMAPRWPQTGQGAPKRPPRRPPGRPERAQII
eukprot:5846570-Pyramimonas_sp.AAC.1